jgi:hypothetical protein
MVVFQVAAGVLLGKVLYDLLDEALSKALPKNPVEKKTSLSKKKPMGKKPAAKRKAKKE